MFLPAHLLMILFAFTIGSKEIIFVREMRKLPEGNDSEGPFHLWGFLSAVIVAAILALWQDGWKVAALTFFHTGVSFWIVYELRLNLALFPRWNYIGKTASLDKFFRRVFEDAAEDAVAVIKALLLLAGFILYPIIR